MALCSRTLLLVTIGTIAFLYLGVSRRQELGVKDFILLAGRFFLALALFSLLISYVTPWIQSYSVTSSRIPPSNVSEVEQEQRKRLARQEQQEKLSEKANVYMDSVLKPRHEVKLRKQEEHFFRMTGQTWKLTEGQRLGETEETANEYENSDDTPNKEALKKRKLPDHVTKSPPPIEPPKLKKVLVLPEEPEETEQGVLVLPEEPEETEQGAVTIALRCPSGRVFRRRFLKTCDSQVLLDWMMKLGYHSSIYTLCTPYPRRNLEIEEGLSLEDVGISTDSVFIVDQTDA